MWFLTWVCGVHHFRRDRLGSCGHQNTARRKGDQAVPSWMDEMLVRYLHHYMTDGDSRQATESGCLSKSCGRNPGELVVAAAWGTSHWFDSLIEFGFSQQNVAQSDQQTKSCHGPHDFDRACPGLKRPYRRRTNTHLAVEASPCRR